VTWPSNRTQSTSTTQANEIARERRMFTSIICCNYLFVCSTKTNQRNEPEMMMRATKRLERTEMSYHGRAASNCPPSAAIRAPQSEGLRIVIHWMRLDEDLN
jgi:hypothetical protein